MSKQTSTTEDGTRQRIVIKDLRLRENRSDEELFEDAASVLKSFELMLKYHAQDNLREKEERDEFVENVNRAAANLSYEDLFTQLSILQKSITESAYTEEGKLWMLPMYLRIIQIRKKLNCNLTTFISIMQLLQGCMKLDSFRDSSTWSTKCTLLKNPLHSYEFHLLLVRNLEDLLGCSIQDFSDGTAMAVGKIGDCVEQLEEQVKSSNIAKTTGGGTAILGGLMVIGGIFLTPLTVGASLGLTAGGIGLAAAGTATTLTASILKNVFTSNRTEEVKKAFSNVTSSMHIFIFVITRYNEEYMIAKDYMQAEEGISLINILKDVTDEILELIATGYSVNNLLEALELVCSLNHAAYEELGGDIVIQVIDGVEDEATIAVETASDSIANQLETAATALRLASSTLTVAVGIWDVVTSAIELSEDNDIVKQLQKTADNLRDSKSHLLKCHRSIILLTQKKLKLKNTNTSNCNK